MISEYQALSVAGPQHQLTLLIRVKDFPWWCGLYHFNNGAMAIAFSDGSTFEDLSKVFL